jgi:hypothetical protein
MKKTFFVCGLCAAFSTTAIIAAAYVNPYSPHEMAVACGISIAAIVVNAVAFIASVVAIVRQ